MATRPPDVSRPDGRADPETERAVAEDADRFIAPVGRPRRRARLHRLGDRDRALYDAGDVADGLEERLGEPGSYPFTRGIHEGMYRDRLWTMRQYAGFSCPEDTNNRYRYLIEHGSTGLSMAFDLPTQLGRDSDDPLCRGEVGSHRRPDRHDRGHADLLRADPARRGLDLDDDQRAGRDPAAALRAGGRGAGRARPSNFAGTVQNDVLKEYVARGNYIYPPEPTMRLTTDIFEYCAENVPKWNTISISGYHIREKGCSAVQEVAFTLANAMAYVQAALDRGFDDRRVRPAPGLLLQLPQQRLPGDRQVPRRAADVGADHARAVRRLGGALADDPLPHPDRRRDAAGAAARGEHHPRRAPGVRRRLRRHPVASHERVRRGARAADRALRPDRPAHAAGDRPRVRRRRHRRPVRRLALRRGADRRDRGALVGADRQGRGDGRLDRGARVHPARDRGVGRVLPRALPLGPGHHRRRQQATSPTRSTTSTSSGSTPRPRSASSSGSRRSRPTATRQKVDAHLAKLREVAEGDGNLLPPIKEALRERASIGEVCGAMRDVFGEYRGGAFF